MIYTSVQFYNVALLFSQSFDCSYSAIAFLCKEDDGAWAQLLHTSGWFDATTYSWVCLGKYILVFILDFFFFVIL